MRLARPPGGFQIKLAPNVSLLIEQACAASPAFATHWGDIEDRLRFTAHIEGQPIESFGAGHRVWAAAGDPDRGLPRVRLVFVVLGSVVRIRIADIQKL